MVKYLNTRNANTAKHSKLAKSKTKLQKGGSAAAAAAAAKDIISISKNDLLDALSEYNNIEKLITYTFEYSTVDKFSYKSTSTALDTSDPFLSIVPADPEFPEYNLDNLYEWYLTKNPGFLPISELENLQIPEFAFITAVMVKDLVILLQTCRFPKKHKNNTNEKFARNRIGRNSMKYFENTYKLNQKILNPRNEKNNFTQNLIRNIAELLHFIDNFIKEGYIYLDFLEILKSYILIFSSGKNVKQDEPEYDQILKHIDYLKNQPYILYPSTEQLDYNKIIFTMKAPFINFRLPNVRPYIHGKFHNILSELEHDIFFHSRITHGLIINLDLITISKRLTLYKDLKKLYNIENPESEAPIIPEQIDREIYKNIFKKSNFIIHNCLKDIITSYRKPATINSKDLDSIKKNNILYIFTILTFYILHEYFHRREIYGLYALFNLHTAFNDFRDTITKTNIDEELLYSHMPTKLIAQYVYNFMQGIKDLKTELPKLKEGKVINNIVGQALLRYLFNFDNMNILHTLDYYEQKLKCLHFC
uniref:Uncharacterized protein n=1 Tax=viral metagenome TaxID=1070528 RepID=A0A6C0HLG4_9ZZZZ